jgi:hypothetical protein
MLAFVRRQQQLHAVHGILKRTQAGPAPIPEGRRGTRSDRSLIASLLIEESADLPSELLQIPTHDRPDQFDVDAHVVVDDLVPHSRDPPPRNARRRIAHLEREVLDGLSDDLDPTDDRVLQLLALAEPPTNANPRTSFAGNR